jgi:hypothetical protein
METQTKKTVAIITRYNEYVDWIDYIINKVDFIYIYNKGPNNLIFKNLVLLFEFIILIIKLYF